MSTDKERSARKAAILEAALDCIVSMDERGNIIEFNRAAEKTFGYTREEVLGKQMCEVIIPARFRETHFAGLQRYLQTEQGKVIGKRLEMSALRKNGSEFPVELSIVALQVRGQRIFTGFLRDISHQQAAKARLHTQYKVMTTLGESKTLQEATSKILNVIVEDLHWLLGAFWIVDESQNVIKAIDLWHVPTVKAEEFIRATKTWDFPPGKGLPGRIWITGKPSWITDVTQDSNFPRFEIAQREGLRGGFGFPILNGKKVLGVMEFFSDQILPPDDELLQVVATLGGQIGQFMNRISIEEALRVAVKSRDEFLSIASHELKTPLTSLKLQLQMTQRSLRNTDLDSSPEILKKSFSTSLRQVDSLTKLVDELLDISRIQTGKLTLNLEETDLSSVVRDVVERFTEQLVRAKITLHLELEGQLVGTWDRYRIEQILFNFLSNIIKYAPGKVATIRAQRMDEKVKLIIEDSGPGIPKEQQSRIFQRFERASTSTNVSGLGLGLFVVKQIVEAHRGQIRLESKVGKGSKFTIELPLKLVLEERVIKTNWPITEAQA